MLHHIDLQLQSLFYSYYTNCKKLYSPVGLVAAEVAVAGNPKAVGAEVAAAGNPKAVGAEVVAVPKPKAIIQQSTDELVILAMYIIYLHL